MERGESLNNNSSQAEASCDNRNKVGSDGENNDNHNINGVLSSPSQTECKNVLNSVLGEVVMTEVTEMLQASNIEEKQPSCAIEIVHEMEMNWNEV
jgi:uncharacterized protein (DUF1499 family)